MKTITVKILTNRIAIDLTPILTYVHAYNLKHGIMLNFDIQSVNINGYTSVYTQVRPGVWFWILNDTDTLVPIDQNHDITIFMFDQLEWKTPPGSNFPLLPNTPTSSTILVNRKPLINLGIYSPDMIGNEIMFCHELMHAYTKLYSAQGGNIVDQMDTYLDNSNPDAPGGNFATQWTLLQSWLNPSQNTVTITRQSDNGIETLGLLSVQKNNASFTCNTLELPWKNNQHDISCIPKGTYKVTIQPFHSTNRYELSPTIPRTGIFIHEGNYYKDSLGCILLGIKPSDINADKQIDVTFSVNTVQAFMQFMNNESFTLIIK